MFGVATRLPLLVVLALVAVAAQAVEIDYVTVGNPRNANDTHGDGYGGVDYVYNIGTYEVTAGQYTEFLNKVGGVDTYGLYNAGMAIANWGSEITQSGGGTLSNPYTYSVSSAFVNRPVNFVSWGDSARFANWMHNSQPAGAQDLTTTEDGAYYLNGATSTAALMAITREADWKWALPTEDEWYKAAYYKGGSTNAGYWFYPTCSDALPGRDLADLSGNNANYGGDPYPIDPPYYKTVVGEFQNSDSPYGTFDQGGNEWEWTEAVTSASRRGRRGGSYNWEAATLHASCRFDADPADESQSFGFRVARIPEPGSITLLVCGALGLLAYGWRRRRG